MTVKNTNNDNKIDDCVAEIIANEGNNENLVPEPCSFINMDWGEMKSKDKNFDAILVIMMALVRYCVYLS